MSDNTDSGSFDATQKALITLGVLGAFILIAVVIAKIVDYCYDQHMAISDDASDISEHTRELIQMRVNAFRTKKKDKTPKAKKKDVSEKQSKIIRIWSAKAKESRRIADQRRAEDAAKQAAARKEIIIKVEEAGGNLTTKRQMLTVPSVMLHVHSETPPDNTLTVVDKADKKDEEKIPKTKSSFPIRPELKRTLSGLSITNNMADSTAVVHVSASGNTSRLSSRGSRSGSPTKVHFADKDVEAQHSELSTPANRPDGSQSPLPKSASPRSPRTPERKSPEPKRPPSKSPPPRPPPSKASGSKSPDPKLSESKPSDSKTAQPKTAVSESTGPKSTPSKTVESKAAAPKPPATKTPEPKPSPSKTPEPKSTPSKSPEPKLPVSKTSDSKAPVSKTPEPNSASKAPESKATEQKTAASKPPEASSPRPKSAVPASPRPKSTMKVQPQSRSPSPVKSPGSEKKELVSNKRREDTGTTKATGGKWTYTPVKPIGGAEAPQDGKGESDTPDSPSKARPASSVPGKLFTTVAPPKRSSSPTKATTSRASSPTKGSPQNQVRPQSLIAKEDPKLKDVHPKLVKSVALYGRATEDLQVHRNLMSKKKTTVSPVKPASDTSPNTNNNYGQSYITPAAAARRAKSKSAKS
ncbi:proteoglycan 4-like isoform X2 [Littorina saxatilis]|uniref:Uncharacterized protein n=1 Tax=Littorina saxatilis TaxID=31220 RepID=A0AAN9GN52_9CAEN